MAVVTTDKDLIIIIKNNYVLWRCCRNPEKSYKKYFSLGRFSLCVWTSVSCAQTWVVASPLTFFCLFFKCVNLFVWETSYQFVTLTKVEKLTFSFSFISFVGSSCVHGHHSTLYGGVHICTWLSVLKRRLLVPSVACRSCLDPLWAQSKASSAGPFFSLSSSGKWLTECR